MPLAALIQPPPSALLSEGASVSVDHLTCWAFLARTEPATLMLMQDPAAGLASDEMRTRRLARAMGRSYALYRAPDALRAEGIAEIGAYPLDVLERAFPVSP